MKEYKARIADKILVEKLDAMGAVLIEGPKYCGKTTLASKQAALQQAIEYFEAVTRFDVSRVDGVNRDSELARRIMRSYARNQGSQATAGTILADIANNESTEVSENTIYSYIKALKKI